MQTFRVAVDQGGEILQLQLTAGAAMALANELRAGAWALDEISAVQTSAHPAEASA